MDRIKKGGHLGFNGTDEEILTIWEGIAKRWDVTSSPWRPSVGDLSIYEKLCGKKLCGNVLILGATPELRDLAGPNCQKLFLVDISKDMILQTTNLLKHSDPNREIWIKNNWCEAPLPKSSFDLVVSDMPWWVLSVFNQTKLCDKIFQVLKPDGFLVTRLRFRDPLKINQNAKKMVEKYLCDFDKNFYAKELIKNNMMSNLYDVTVDESLMRINREKTKTVLLDISRRLLDSRHRDFVVEASSRILGADWTSQTRQESLDILQKRFVLKEELLADDYESEFYPIMKFIKNGNN